MKKIAKRSLFFTNLFTVVLALNQVALADDKIQLPIPNGGHIPIYGNALYVPVSGVVKNDVGYNITCHVNNLDAAVLSIRGLYCVRGKKENPTCIPSLGIYVNGLPYTPNQQNTYHPGDNIVTFKALEAKANDSSGALFFSTLSSRTQQTITSCTAVPLH